MTMIVTGTVTEQHHGSVTTAAETVPTTTAQQFRPTVPTQAGSVPADGPVPGSVRRPPVPRRGWNRTDPLDAASEIHPTYVTTDGWTAWVAVEVDRGAGWEVAQQGRVLIEAGTQAHVDQLVDDLAVTAQVGERYAVVRVSAVTCDTDGRAVMGYLVTELPLLHRPGRRRAGTTPSTNEAAAAYATA